MIPLRHAVMGALAGLLLSGCVTQSVKRVNSTTAHYADRELAPDELLDIAIEVFDPGVPDTLKAQQDRNIVPAVREAEAKYIPYQLRQTMQKTGHWGAVRVVPENSALADVVVRGRILDSDGERLRVSVAAQDATGRTWLQRTYEETAAEFAYTEKLPAGTDPFQDLYNRIANDLLAERAKLRVAELATLKRTTELRFAARLSPDRFGPYLQRDRQGRVTPQRLPPANDPMLERVAQVRARDELFVDTLDQHYAVYQQNIRTSYQDWRAASYREAMTLRELKAQEWTRKILGAAAVVGGVVAASQAETATQSNLGQLAVIGGIYAFQSGMAKGTERKMYEESLQELSRSLGTDVAPQTVALEGKTVMLTGSAEEQYRQWQALMRQLYTAETGLPADVPGGT